ncbi:ComF family protein [Thalassotalea sp. SU-HH00458]|uniref:ComF family protein n=1 Tax=Thalassotalea sp. SU-HH00458 TaxID=3127657 RepID=UPI0031074365
MELDNKIAGQLFTHLHRYFAECLTLTRQTMSECELCKSAHVIHPLLCQYCYDDLPLFSYQHFGFNLLNWPAIDKLFPQRSFEQLLCLAPYIAPFDQWLIDFKYQKRFELADLLGYLLAELWQKQVNEQQDVAILSVPIHLKKWQQRGFNQAHLIARAFNRRTKIPYLEQALRRTTYSKSQVGQSGKLRRKLLKNAFALSEEFDTLPSHIILLDDVITTGSTVNTLCKLLKLKGVKHITVLTVALTLPK